MSDSKQIRGEDENYQQSMQKISGWKSKKRASTSICDQLVHHRKVTKTQEYNNNQENSGRTQYSELYTNAPEMSEIEDAIAETLKWREENRQRRHRERIQIYKTYQDKLLEQHEQATRIHKELMEKLMNRLLES